METELKILLVGVWFFCLFCVEKIPRVRMRPMASLFSETFIQRIGCNFSFYFFNGLAYPLVAAITIYASGHSLGWRDDLLANHFFSGVSGGWLILLDILILDLMIYGWHRLNHKVPFLWRFHEVHHLDEMLDTTTAVRFHFGEVLLSACNRSIFIILLDIPVQSVLIVETLLLLIALFHHANIHLYGRLDQILSLVLVTPRMHHAHHHALQRDTDSNYGNLFSFWDRIFNSYNARIFSKNAKIGVEGVSEKSFRNLWLHPINKKSNYPR